MSAAPYCAGGAAAPACCCSCALYSLFAPAAPPLPAPALGPPAASAIALPRPQEQYGTHLTSPAMSHTSRKAGTVLLGLYRSHSQVNRSSGTFMRACRAQGGQHFSADMMRLPGSQIVQSVHGSPKCTRFSSVRWYTHLGLPSQAACTHRADEQLLKLRLWHTKTLQGLSGKK